MNKTKSNLLYFWLYKTITPYLLTLILIVIINRNNVRYQYTHEILNDGVPSVFSDRCIVRKRRISIVMRNEPPVDVMK